MHAIEKSRAASRAAVPRGLEAPPTFFIAERQFHPRFYGSNFTGHSALETRGENTFFTLSFTHPPTPRFK